MKTHGVRRMMIALALAATQALAIEVPLKFTTYGEPALGFRPRGMARLGPLATTPPAGVKLPEFVGEKQAFGTLAVAGEKFLIALDKAAASDKFYRRLYIDRNQDGHLADEQFIFSHGSSVNYASWDVTIEREVAGKKLPYCFSVSVRMVTTSISFTEGMEDGQQLSGYVNLGCAYVGEFDAEGKHYRVAIGDANCNGRFDDCHSQSQDGKVSSTSGGKQILFREGDAFLISENPVFDANELLVLGTHLVLGATTYKVNIDIANGKMTLTLVSEGMVALGLPAGTALLELVSADHQNSVMLVDPAAIVQVPPGRYQMFKYMLKKQDAQGDTWCAVAQRGAQAADFTVDGSDVALKFGEPFEIQVKTTASMAAVEGMRQARLTLAIQDAMGMDVRGVFHVAGGKTAIPLSPDRTHPGNPQYVIRQDDQILAQGQFEYG